MINNHWLTGSLFLGLLITVSLVSSIPAYTSSVLQKLLVSEMENHLMEKQEFPTEFMYSVNFSKDPAINRLEALHDVEELNVEIIGDTEVNVLTDVKILSTVSLPVRHEETPQPLHARILSFSNFEKHIIVTDGKLPSNQLANGVYEALVPEKALFDRDMVLGTTFEIGEGETSFLVKPVGTFIANDSTDPYWTLSPDSYSRDFIIPESLFQSQLIKNEPELLETGKFITAFDYHSIKSRDIPPLLKLERKVKAEISSRMETILLTDFPAQQLLSTYEQKGHQLKIMLWSINIPILVMLVIYLFMVSRLIINRQLSEIAVLASRGAKRRQILTIYLIEVTLLGLIALIVGPFIGLQFTKMLGATSGFLEFVQRKALQVELLPESYVYGFLAILASILMVMIPVYQATKQSVVSHKKYSDLMKGNKWYFLFVYLFLVAVSIYGLLSFGKVQILNGSPGEKSIPYVDPTLYFLPAIFIIGMGLLVLALYPYVLKLIFHVGKKFWSVPIYSTLLQVSRSTKQYHFLMLFLIMTIGVGVYSASAAHTLNTNLEEQIRYQNGADIRLDIYWENSQINAPIVETTGDEVQETEADTNRVKEVVYNEPPFETFTFIEGIEQTAKVFHKQSVKAESKGQSIFSAELMAIEPNAFGKTAWFKQSLLPHHWYHYLNLMASEPSAVLISRTTASKLGVEEGDYLTLQWNGSDKAEFVIYGIVDYWPSFNPIEEIDDGGKRSLIIANLPYVQNFMGLEPYQVWLKTDSVTTRQTIYESIKKSGQPIRNMEDIQPKLNELKNSAFLLGLNGSLSLGFLISIMISLIGFLIYWIVTIKSRTLQYGVYRAIGISIYQLIRILIWEQLLTSGIACLFGVVIGAIASRLFVPLFQLSFNPETIVPPFNVIFDSSDEMKIYYFVISMLVIGITILIVLLRKIKIHQAIKMGEDT